METRRWVLAGTGGLVAALGVGAYGAAAAPSPAHPVPARAAHTAKVSDYGMVIGPLRGRDGFRAIVEAEGCGTKDSLVSVAYEKVSGRAALNHSYIAAGRCTISTSLHTATLTARWGSAVRLALTVATTSGTDRVSAEDGCASNYLEIRRGQSAGTGRLAIHNRDFGALSLGRDAAELVAQVGTCRADSGTSSGTGGGAGTRPISGGGSGFHLARREPAVPTTTATTPTPPTVTPDRSGSQFEGVFDRGALVAEAEDEGTRAPLITLEDLAPHDAPARGVIAEMDVVIQAPADFTVGQGDDTAELAAANRFVSGTLDFTATALCRGSTQALEGRLLGRLTIHDPIIGAVSFDGSTAVGAAVGDNDASLETC